MIRTAAIVFVVALMTAQSAEPDVFGAGTISLPDSHDDYLSLSPDGNTAVFTRLEAGYRGGTLYLADRSGGQWQNARVAPFSGQHQDSRPAFSTDGRRIIFASNRPAPGRKDRRDLDLWVVRKQGTGWSEPTAAAGINSAINESHPSLASSGALFFVRRAPNSNNDDLYRAAASGEGWAEPVRLPDTVNSAGPDSHVFVDPAERFLLFARNESSSGDDVFVSVKRAGAWAAAERLGAPVNTPAYEYSAKIYGTPAMLYFTRNGQWTGGKPAEILRIPVRSVPSLAAALGLTPPGSE